MIDPRGTDGDCDTCKVKKSSQQSSSSFDPDWNNSEYAKNVVNETGTRVVKEVIQRETGVKNLSQGSATREAERMRKLAQEEATCNAKKHKGAIDRVVDAIIAGWQGR
jgi:hypothetical protein